MQPASLDDQKVRAVVEAAAAAGVTLEPVTFERETRTSADAAREIGCTVDEIVKSLVFAITGSAEPVLLLLSGSDRVDPIAAAKALGVDGLERADPVAAKAATGFSIGATSPLGLATPIRIAMDDRLLGFDRVWAAGGRPDTVFPIAPRTLLEISGAELHTLREV